MAGGDELRRAEEIARHAVEELEMLSRHRAESGAPLDERIHRLAAAAMIVTWEIGHLVGSGSPESPSTTTFDVTDDEPIDRALRRWAEHAGSGRSGAETIGSELRRLGDATDPPVVLFAEQRWITVGELRRRFPSAESIDVSRASQPTLLFDALTEILGWNGQCDDPTH